MIRTFLSLLILCSAITKISAQEIVNIVLVGNEGITDNIKKAHSFIAIKKYSANLFERLDYKLGAPLVKLRSYGDSNLTILNGPYLEYYPSGGLNIKGQYENSLQEGDWYYYNDTGKSMLTEKYLKGKLIESHVPDTTVKKTSLNEGDREADWDGGIRKWIRYLQNNLNADLASKSVKGGSVRVLFTINTVGKATSVFLKKSVEFILDEEAIRVIRTSPEWVPALEAGKPVNAYRIQPITFVKE
jgi:TonB family protein